MRALAEALRFLTIIPLPGRPPSKSSSVIAVYPWAGLILGLICAAAAWAGGLIFGAAGTAVVTVVIRIAITGGLHMDGLADLADGLGGGRDREKRLAIMSDSRLGSFGALALISMFSLQVVLIAELITTGGGPGLQIYYPLVLAPAVSRGIIPLMMRIFPSARPGGMGDRNRASANPAAVTVSVLSVLIIAAFFYGIPGIIFTVAVCGVIVILAAGISRRLGGLSGDVYGALIESGDLLVFMSILLILHLGLPAQGLINLIL